MRPLAWLLVCLLLATSCQDHRQPIPPVLSCDAAHAWMQLQIRLTLTTTGYNSVVSDCSFGYAGITMYEAVLPGIEGSTPPRANIGGNAHPQKCRSVLLARKPQRSHGQHYQAVLWKPIGGGSEKVSIRWKRCIKISFRPPPVLTT